ncbi:hypothetical protein [Streptomyces sp. NPDC048551]|uniref:hypothetical protein n=1 Tax=Streptomyces sp. NPDC048551 TaxID=3155758 RepID=UPI003440C074
MAYADTSGGGWRGAGRGVAGRSPAQRAEAAEAAEAPAPGGGPDRGRTSGPTRKPAPKAAKPRG